MNPYEYRRRFSLDLPFKCEGFTIDDCVEYINDNGELCKGYIYCFREYDIIGLLIYTKTGIH